MKHKKVLGSTGLLLFYLGVFLVFIAPIVRLLFMSLKGSDGYGLSNYQVLLQEKRTREAIFNTILIAASSTMIAIVAGSGLALAAAYNNIKRKRLLELLVLLPFIIPSYIITLSWSGFLSKKGIVNQILGAVGIGSGEYLFHWRYFTGDRYLQHPCCIHECDPYASAYSKRPGMGFQSLRIWSFLYTGPCGSGAGASCDHCMRASGSFYQPLITSLCRHF